MVDVSLAILRGEKGASADKQSIHARRFALKALRQASGVEIPIDELEEWANSKENLQLTPVNVALGTTIGRLLDGKNTSALE